MFGMKPLLKTSCLQSTKIKVSTKTAESSLVLFSSAIAASLFERGMDTIDVWFDSGTPTHKRCSHLCFRL